MTRSEMQKQVSATTFACTSAGYHTGTVRFQNPEHSSVNPYWKSDLMSASTCSYR